MDEFIEKVVDVPGLTAYSATVDLARNISVRLEQSGRARRATVVAIIVSPEQEAESVRHIEDALVDYLSRKRPHAEGMVIQLDAAGANVTLVVHPPGADRPHLKPFIFPKTTVTQSTEYRWRKVSLGELTFISVDRDQPVLIQEFPFAVLRSDDWDDFGVKSLFHLTVHLDAKSQYTIGFVKIARHGQYTGRIGIPDEPFQALPPEYFSLGQNFSYYENLKLLGVQVHERILRGLRDTVLDASILKRAQQQKVWSTSLARMSSAKRALLDAPSIFSQQRKRSNDERSFTFETSVGGNWFQTHFLFSTTSPIPSRINAVIGYNGSGKTQLLANLALAATTGNHQDADERQYGSILSNSSILFSSVITVSYSAFDTFTLPDHILGSAERQQAAQQLLEHGEVFGYSYFGLRENYFASQDTPNSLKSIDSITKEFVAALSTASTPRRQPVLARALEILFEDPSFGRPGIVEELSFDDIDQWVNHFQTFSTGHKIVLNVLTQLISRCDPNSLVLIDEPESHLHPSLLAAFIQSLTLVLNEFDSYAVVATHSPVVLQEIPRKYVHIISRFGSISQVSSPTGETFGENIATLTRESFGLDSARSDYHSVLQRLSRELTIEQIEAVFDGELSSNARAYLLTLSRRNARTR
ncbi:AAA family ATPase [Rhodococcus oxybenzonivorans]|uniref:AAA family ATPase n=1 Tax=Rhodococcus oxybenzonivorans TaxID=1990687 RepID=UPI00194E1DCC|nr:AAA family ATPase [Rhodococcus oxybenzonivorans]